MLLELGGASAWFAVGCVMIGYMDEPTATGPSEIDDAPAPPVPVVVRRRRRGVIGLIQNVILLITLVLLIALILSVVRIPIRMAKRKGHPELERIKAFAYFGMVFPPLWVMAFVMASGGGGVRKGDAQAVRPELGAAGEEAT